MNATPFFSTGSELAVLERHVQRLRASAHSPPVNRAECVLVDIQRALFRKHEAELQVRIAAGTGYHDHQQVWQGKIDTIDQQIAELTIALRGRVLGLRTVTFQRFAAAMVIGIVALRRLFNPPADGRPPPVLRAYIEECEFVSDEPTAR